MRLRQLAGTHGHIAWQHHIQPQDSSSSAPPVQPDQTGQSGISALPPFSLMPALPGRGVVSASVAAPPEDDPKVLNALSFLAFDGQDQVPQAAASTVKVQMILETEIRCEPPGMAPISSPSPGRRSPTRRRKRRMLLLQHQ